MKRVLDINRSLIIFGAPLCLLLCLVLLMRSSWVANESLSIAITVDLLLTVPLLYFFLIRKTEIPKTTVVPVLLLGLLLGSLFLPKESQTYLSFFKSWFLPLIELSVLSYVLYKVRLGVREYKLQRGIKPDFFSALKTACREILPSKLVSPFATEIAVFYYGFVHWKKHRFRDNEFSYHQKSTATSLFIAIILIVGIETFVLHALIAKWSTVVAWILSALSVYTGFQLFGFMRSLSRRPIVLEDDELVLRYGIMSEVRIPHDNISKVMLSQKDLEEDKLTATLSPLGTLEPHNVVIDLKTEASMQGLYGIRKPFIRIGFHVDEPGEFMEKLQAKRSEYSF